MQQNVVSGCNIAAIRFSCEQKFICQSNNYHTTYRRNYTMQQNVVSGCNVAAIRLVSSIPCMVHKFLPLITDDANRSSLSTLDLVNTLCHRYSGLVGDWDSLNILAEVVCHGQHKHTCSWLKWTYVSSPFQPGTTPEAQLSLAATQQQLPQLWCISLTVITHLDLLEVGGGEVGGQLPLLAVSCSSYLVLVTIACLLNSETTSPFALPPCSNKASSSAPLSCQQWHPYPCGLPPSNGTP